MSNSFLVSKISSSLHRVPAILVMLLSLTLMPNKMMADDYLDCFSSPPREAIAACTNILKIGNKRAKTFGHSLTAQQYQEAYYHRGEAYFDLGQANKAMFDLVEYLTSHPSGSPEFKSEAMGMLRKIKGGVEFLEETVDENAADEAATKAFLVACQKKGVSHADCIMKLLPPL